MSWAVKFVHDGTPRHTRFAHMGARLPVSARGGAQILLLCWGRRPREPGELPRGGWAKLTHIQSGVWDRYDPKPVRLPVIEFAERDVLGQEQWFQVTRGQVIQGALCRWGNERRAYVVTMDCSPEETEFERWPRIVTPPVAL